MRPYCDTALPINASTSAAFETSVATQVASPPAFLMASTVALPERAVRLATTTFAPAAPNASAVARPIPDPPPVTTATLF